LPLPAELLMAVAHPGGGRIVVVVGAGCSMEAPTSLQQSRDLARAVHRRLRDDGVLDVDCPNPDDLSSVADAVYAKTGSQRDLVERLPIALFRNAQPNDGYLLAAALLCEQAISCLMTLNFDLAMSHAIPQAGAGNVSIITGPGDTHRLSLTNVVYLHRNVDAAPDDWVLRSAALDSEWRGGWGQFIAERVLASPVTVFAGLGTAVGVLIDSVRRIRAMLPAVAPRVFQVDPGDRAGSAFSTALQIRDEEYIQLGWVEFMEQLSLRLAREHCVAFRDAANVLVGDEGWEEISVDDLCSRVQQLGLLGLGRLRARWTLHDNPLLPQREIEAAWIAKLLLGIALIEKALDSEAEFGLDGTVEFRRANEILFSIVLASGRGTRRWVALEGAIRKNERHWRHRNPPPRSAVVAGVEGGRPMVPAAKASIAAEEDKDSIVVGAPTFDLVSVDELHDSPVLISHLLL